MKRFLALILALTMALALAACGGGNEPAAESPAGGTEPFPGKRRWEPGYQPNCGKFTLSLYLIFIIYL